MFQVEPTTSYQPDILITHSCTPPVENINCALLEFIAGEDRCSKFINQDLTFLQPFDIPSTFRNMLHNDNSSVKVSQSQTQVVSSTIELSTLLRIKTQHCQHKKSSQCWDLYQRISKRLRKNQNSWLNNFLDWSCVKGMSKLPYKLYMVFMYINHVTFYY